MHLPSYIDNICRIGFYAKLDSSGFRQDGSFYYGRQIHKLEIKDSTASDFLFKETLERVEKGIIGFEHGRQINHKAVEIFQSCLEFCRQHNIHVICVMPPFADAVYERMINSDNHTYIKDIEPALLHIAETESIELYVYHHASACGSSDEEFIDGRHGSEKTYLRILLDILSRESVLNSVCHPHMLQQKLETSARHYQLFDSL